jgi:chemotaxis regulatin CheY-phosphate phosphatase CheZ
MDPGSIGGKMASRNFTSGFHAMIAMSDNLEAVEMDKPVFQDAEKDFWEITKRWHNWMFDIGVLNDEARKLGKFSDDLEVAVSFAEIKPLESDQETITQIKDLRTEGLITKFDALKRLHPDLSDDQIQDKIDEIEEELAKSRQKAIDMLQGSDPSEQDSMQMSEKISNEDGKDEGEEPTPGKMVTAKMPSKPMPMQVQAKGK